MNYHQTEKNFTWITTMSYEDSHLDYYGEAPPFPEAATKYPKRMKECRVCNQTKEMPSNYGVCDSCADKIEAGLDPQ